METTFKIFLRSPFNNNAPNKKTIKLTEFDSYTGYMLAKDVCLKWLESLVDEDTGEVIDITRHSVKIPRYTIIDDALEKQIKSLLDQYHIEDLVVFDIPDAQNELSIMLGKTKNKKLIDYILTTAIWVDTSEPKQPKQIIAVSQETIARIMYPNDDYDYYKRRSFDVFWSSKLKPILILLGFDVMKIYKSGFIIFKDGEELND